MENKPEKIFQFRTRKFSDNCVHSFAILKQFVLFRVVCIWKYGK